MCVSKGLLKVCLIGFASLIFVSSVGAEEKNWDITPYGSLRLQANYSMVDNAMPGEDDSYVDFTDAYSRLGVRGRYSVNDNLNLSAQLEVSINLPEFRAEDPTFFDDNAMRVKKIAASGNWGSAWIGKGWLPYYNNIAYPVDMFSSFYSGYATYAYFRENAAVYSTPSIGGFTGTVARLERTPENERGYQGVISYTYEALTLSVAGEKMDDVNDTYGAAVSYTHGSWYGALKYERHDNDADNDITNLFISYAADKFTYKAMVADGDLWGKEYTTAQTGVDYQHTKAVKFFIELFYESNAYAILDKNANSASEYLGISGGIWSEPDSETDGTSLAIGVRYDF